jgi:hypothetical protein
MNVPPTLNVLVVTGGHPFSEPDFFAMFDAMAGIEVTSVAHPEATDALAPDALEDYATVLFYDMAGIPGTGVPDGSDEAGHPAEAFKANIDAMLERGIGLVLLNHATVAWPNWPRWRQITRSSFMLMAGELNGEQLPGSGYRGGHGPHPNPTFRLIPEGQHPVLDGLQDGFEITDEIYLKSPGFESSVLPLLRGDYPFEAANFTPPPMAPAEEQADWQHPPGSNLLVWANALASSPIVVSELGDSPSAFSNPGFRKLLENALRWTASEDARVWASTAQ